MPREAAAARTEPGAPRAAAPGPGGAAAQRRQPRVGLPARLQRVDEPSSHSRATWEEGSDAGRGFGDRPRKGVQCRLWWEKPVREPATKERVRAKPVTLGRGPSWGQRESVGAPQPTLMPPLSTGSSLRGGRRPPGRWAPSGPVLPARPADPQRLGLASPGSLKTPAPDPTPNP